MSYTTRSRRTLLVVTMAAALGCSSSGMNQNGGTGGTPGTGGVATGGTPGTGGITTGTGGGTGGSPATGGIVGTGGSGTGGSAGTPGGGHPGTGGAAGATAGHSGTGGTPGGGGSVGTLPAKPSPGCGKGGRPSGGQVSVSNTSLYMFPTSYDGTKPFPLLIALHACGNPNTEFVSLTNGTAFETDYVRSFPNTPDSGQCWSNYSGDVSRILSQYDDVVNNYCVDENRVFAIAHSSGAQMLVNILSHKSDAQHLNLKAISPVAADPYNVAIPMPVLYIDGQHDNQRSATSATDTVAKFRAANSCASTSKPYDVMTCNSTDSGHPLVDPGCIIYDNCTVPTIWCSHNDPSYSGTEHGVPCFAMKAMQDFFAGIP
jgi:polyhydroxybutyrate depolymerase